MNTLPRTINGATLPENEIWWNPQNLDLERFGPDHRPMTKTEWERTEKIPCEFWYSEISEWHLCSFMQVHTLTYRLPAATPFLMPEKPEPFAAEKAAFSQGKVIQCATLGKEDWEDCGTFTSMGPPGWSGSLRYRVKPEPESHPAVTDTMCNSAQDAYMTASGSSSRPSKIGLKAALSRAFSQVLPGMESEIESLKDQCAGLAKAAHAGAQMRDERDTALSELQKARAKITSMEAEMVKCLAIVNAVSPVKGGDSLSASIAYLKTKLAYAEDAARKGEQARQTAGAMEMQIARLNRDNDQIVAEWRDLAETLEKFTVHTTECRLSRDPFEDTLRFCTCGLYQVQVKLHELKAGQPWTDFSDSFIPTAEDSEPV